MTTDKRGVSALLVQRQLGLSCYETAWMMLHKLRRAMVNAPSGSHFAARSKLMIRGLAASRPVSEEADNLRGDERPLS